MSDVALYTSPCAARSLWHEYRVYADRVELDTLTGTLAVPFDQIEGVHVAASYSQGVRLQLSDDPQALQAALEGALAAYRQRARGN